MHNFEEIMGKLNLLKHKCLKIKLDSNKITHNGLKGLLNTKFFNLNYLTLSNDF